MNWRKIDLNYKAFPRTCQWIFGHPVYVEWLASPQGPLWIKGKPGSGKSTLMEVITQKFRKQSQSDGTLLLTFFFNAFGREPLEKSTAGMYRSLLHQLLDQDPPSLAEFQYLYERRKQTQQHANNEASGWHDKEQNQLREFFTQALETIADRGTKIAIFIDALDEAVHGSAQDVIIYLHRLDEVLRQREAKARICISCWHYPIYAVTDHHEIFMEQQNDVDIREFVRTELAEKGILRREYLERSGTLITIEEELVKRACGVFLWAYLIIPVVVAKLNVATPLDILLASLDQAPTRLGEIYADIIRNVIHQDLRLDSYRLMKWASCNDEPFMLVRIATSVHFTAAYTMPSTYSDLSEEDKDVLEIRVGNFSGGLLEVKLESRERAAFFIHPTVKTFLKDEGLRLLSRLQVAVPATSPHSYLTEDATHVGHFESIASSEEAEIDLDDSSHIIYKSSLNPEDLQALADKYSTSSAAAGNDGRSMRKPESASKRDRNSHRVSYAMSNSKKDKKQSLLVMEREPRQISIDAHETMEGEKHAMSTSQWFDRLFRDTHPLLQFEEATEERVKIAIIGSGIDMSHPTLREAEHQVKQTKAWINGEGDQDDWGYGTHAASLILKIAPATEIYVARVAGTRHPSIDPKHVTKAINWALDLKVDIIALPISFDRAIPEVYAVIRGATENGTIVIAAASSLGISRTVAFPAQMRDVIAAFSADAVGNVSRFSPHPPSRYNSFSFLGEDVESAWPIDLGEGPTKHLSGSSVATAVAAGIASLILQFVKSESQSLSPALRRYVNIPEGMRKVFQFLSSGRDSHGYVTPWKLLNKRQGRANTVELIKSLFERDAVLWKHEKDVTKESSEKGPIVGAEVD